ncbi:hypothetical protein [Paenibacillus gansuensis]|uniref:Uncharacterized protein n=1 Tax=Paenibacillus gansuensis TaxID=306542 RepID=A0ABW5PB62_9BACL
MESLTALPIVEDQVLAERMESVQILHEDEITFYEVAKDKLTGEHYLHHAYIHRDVAAGGTLETYHYFMPLAHDEVIGMVLGEAAYSYPEHWHGSFLRNGPEGRYVWFDPSGTKEDGEFERTASELQAKLKEFKHSGQTDPESVARLLKEIDGLWKE